MDKVPQFLSWRVVFGFTIVLMIVLVIIDCQDRNKKQAAATQIEKVVRVPSTTK